MEKKLTRRESRETAFLTAFAATFEPEEPTVPAEEHAAPDAFANQLLAALGLLAVCAWLGNAGRNNKMFYVPMAFMMVVTLTSLALTVWAKIGLLAAGTMDAATVLQLVIGVLLMVFAVILAVKGCKTIFGKKRVA